MLRHINPINVVQLTGVTFILCVLFQTILFRIMSPVN